VKPGWGGGTMGGEGGGGVTGPGGVGGCGVGGGGPGVVVFHPGGGPEGDGPVRGGLACVVPEGEWVVGLSTPAEVALRGRGGHGA
jgi:hypothetical protein